jgi:hypothetical protein
LTTSACIKPAASRLVANNFALPAHRFFSSSAVSFAKAADAGSAKKSESKTSDSKKPAAAGNKANDKKGEATATQASGDAPKKRINVVSPLAKMRDQAKGHALNAEQKAVDVSFLKLPGTKIIQDETVLMIKKEIAKRKKQRLQEKKKQALEKAKAKGQKERSQRRNFWDIVTKFEDYGKGMKLRRSIWPPAANTYWTLTRVALENYNPGQVRGKAWGIFTYRGTPQATERQIRGLLKKEWRVVNEKANPRKLRNREVNDTPKYDVYQFMDQDVSPLPFDGERYEMKGKHRGSPVPRQERTIHNVWPAPRGRRWIKPEEIEDHFAPLRNHQAEKAKEKAAAEAASQTISSQPSQPQA